MALFKGKWIHVTTPATIEPRLNRIKGYRHLPQLQTGLQQEIQRDDANGDPHRQIAGPKG